jgi:hypothetical protein
MPVSGWRAVPLLRETSLSVWKTRTGTGVIADGRTSRWAVHKEAVKDVDKGMDGVDVRDQAARGLRLTDRDNVLGFQAAENSPPDLRDGSRRILIVH